MTTTRQAVVTANVAGKTAQVTVQLNPRTGLTLTAPTTSLSALQPASFTVAVAGTANIRDVRVAWGDGSSQSLGALTASTTVTHIFEEAGSYTVSATATDASGFSESVSTTVTVLPAQPPSVIVSATPSTAVVGQTVVVRAQVQGNTSAIIRYEWSFDAGAVPPTATTTGNQVTVSWNSATPATKIIFVRAFQASGPSGDGFGAVTISNVTTATAEKK
jgi:PKD repeat protein